MSTWTTTELELNSGPRVILRLVRSNWWVGTFEDRQICVGTLPQAKRDAEAWAAEWRAKREQGVK